MRLANKVAVITGAGSGIGRTIAYLFAKEGAKAVVADINVAGGEETVAAIKKNGGEGLFIKADVSIASEAENLARTTVSKFGKLDVLVNNAGIMFGLAAIEDMDESVWDKIYAVNVKGIFLTTKYAVPAMKKAGGGVIINIGSMAGVRPRPNNSAYCSSKGAVNTLTKALALELAPHKIRVNCINPWATRTPILEALPEEELKKTASIIPLGRLGKTEDVANAALYLASDESSMLTGTSINVDGGYGI